MASLTVEVNGRPYVVGCEDGQEAHVQALARAFDRQVRDVALQVGQVGDLRLFLMASLLVADEVSDGRARAAAAEVEASRLRIALREAETRAAAALTAAAARVEALTAGLG